MGPVDVVISGIGGRFPQANNIEELGKQLLAGKSLLVPTDKWTPGIMDTPKLVGMTEGLEEFDLTYFGMHPLLTTLTDPIARIALEASFEAFVDAGINPTSLRGSNTQVYTGITQFESDSVFDILVNSTGYAIMGRNRCMVANRISYFFNLIGRSCSYDGSNSWIGEGLHFAREAIQSGECDTAIVLGMAVSIFLSAHKNKQMFGLLSPDSELHPFDDQVNGFGRGDGQIAFVIQRADIAKRSYGSIVVSKTEFQGTLPRFLSVDGEHLRSFVSSEYLKNGLDPSKVKILEADGFCNKEMVETELKALDEVLNAGRSKDTPLYLGTVKSIVGESEGASGFNSLAKLILAMETGVISPTVNVGKLNPNIQGLTDGRFKVVTEPTKWEVTPDTVVAASSVSYNGVVGHVALQANGKTKKAANIEDYALPYLILISGRNENIVEQSLEKVASSPFDPEYLRLIQEVFAPTIDRYDWKGYGFYHGEAESTQKFVIQRANRRPVWFVFSGMGSQWARCGRELMLIPVINETMQRLHKILKPKGLDLLRIVTQADEPIFDNILNSFVCITSIQIALTNLLFQLGIQPDGIIGHSVGEVGCSYADGCLTEEQAILAAYYRGLASVEADLIPGLMAAVGLGGDEAQKLLPPEVVVACRNSNTSCTISGPTTDVEKVITTLHEKEIFVRGVNVANIAYHSPYIKPIAPSLRKYLQEVIPSPKLRSSKWICTSAPKEKWETDEVRHCSAEYQTNNLLSTVFFEEGAAFIPKNALVIELAPHGLLQAILKRSLGGAVAHVPLTRRGASSPAKYLLEAIGKLYLEGLSPKIWLLYPDVPMPVSRNTPSLVPLIEWVHEDRFIMTAHITGKSSDFSSHEVNNQFSPCTEVAGIKYLVFAHVLTFVWERCTEQARCEFKTSKILFEGVEFHEPFKLEEKGTLEVTTNITKGERVFESFVGDSLIVKGKIRLLDDVYDTPLKHPDVKGSAKLCLELDDIYAELKSRCIGVPEQLKSIHKLHIYPQDWIAEVDFSDGNWSRLLNSLLVMFQLHHGERNQRPAFIKSIRRLVIDPTRTNSECVAARLHLPNSTLRFGGVEIYDVELNSAEIPPASSEPACVQFIPYGKCGLKKEETFLTYIMQLCLEMKFTPPHVFRIVDVDNNTFYSLSKKLRSILSTKFSMNSEMSTEIRRASVILCAPESIPLLPADVFTDNILVLSEYDSLNQDFLQKSLETRHLEVLAKYEGHSTGLVAITGKLQHLDPSNTLIIKMGPEDEIIPLKATESSHKFIILVWENGSKKSPSDIYSGMLTLEGAEKLRLMFLMTPNAPPFSLDLNLYSEQLRLNIPVNVYFDGKWGTYRTIPLPKLRDANFTLDFVVESQSTLKGNSESEVQYRYVGLNNEQLTAAHEVSRFKKGVVDYSGECSKKGKIMGVASFDDGSGCYVRDPSFIWSVPKDWTLEEAATVPYAYAFAFLALCEIAGLEKGENVFISCPLTPVGQAALRIAFSYSCDVYVLLGSYEERDQLQKMFPILSQDKIIISTTDKFAFQLKKIEISVALSDLTGTRLRACARSLKFAAKMVQISSETMHAKDYLGMLVFYNQLYFYGVSERKLLDVTLDAKKRIWNWVQKGLDSGVVEPNLWKQSYTCDKISEATLLHGENIIKRVVSLGSSNFGIQNRRNTLEKSQTVIIGGSKCQWMKLAYRLAQKGKKHISIVPDEPSSKLSARHTEILRDEYRIELRELTPQRNGADLFKEITNVGPIEAVFVFEHDRLSEEVVHEIISKQWTDVEMFFFSKDSTYFTRMCERWAQEGLKVKATLGIEDVPLDRSTPLMDWLLSSESPYVSDLTGQKYSIRSSDLASLSEDQFLPVSSTELIQLGASIRGKETPVFKEVNTRCTGAKFTSEIQPLFYMKGIHGRASWDVETIGSDLLAPMFQVTLNESEDSLEDTATAVVQEMLKIQSDGPFNLCGDPIRTDLVLRVACILESKGFASSVLLMDDGINDIREELSILQKGNKLSSSIIKSCLAQDGLSQEWTNVDWSQLSWTKQVSTAVSRIATITEKDRENIILALEHVKRSVQHIIEARDVVTLKHSVVHFIRKDEDYQDCKLAEQRYLHTVPASHLSSKKISETISSNLATPVLQLNATRDRRRKGA